MSAHAPDVWHARILAAFFFVLSAIATEAGHLLVLPAGAIAIPAFSPLSGLLAGTLIMTDRRRWPRLAAAACGAMALSTVALHGRPVVPALGLSLIVASEAWAVAWLVRRTTDAPFALDRVPHAWRLIAATMLATAAAGAPASALLGPADLPSFLAAWRSWWLADSIGILLTAPIAVAVIAERARLAGILAPWPIVEMAIVFGGAVAAAQGIFGDMVDPVLRVPAFMLPFLLWPVFRFGPGRASAMLLILSSIGLWHAGHGLGPLALGGAVADQLLRSQGAAVIAAISLLLLASVVAERKRTAHEHLVLVGELQQALAEVKTLRGFIPICAWCHKVRDDAGFWQQIEAYLDARTDATFSHSICPACADTARIDIDDDDPRPPRIIRPA